ncbi:MAG: ATP-binding cassette domain-containing protein [Oligoflexia bacterium]|nr:ATP-binding cassette domain-containing protein [Oligoflexia bacterium]
MEIEKGQKKAIIELRGICKEYGPNIVLKDISLDFFPGRFYGLLGPNGAGKSTLLKIMSKQEFYNSGRGSILGIAFEKDLGIHKEDIGFVSEEVNFNFPVPLDEFFRNYSRAFPRWDQSLFMQILSEQEIDLSRQFNTYSRGQQMQIVLIATIVRKPKILFIDEVTSVLDVYARGRFIEYFYNFVKNGGTAIITTNIIREIENFVTDVIIINKGNLLLDSDINATQRNYLKIRKTNDNRSNEIFNSKELFWIGRNSDGSNSYLIEEHFLKDLDVQSPLRDRRKISLEEVLLYKVGRIKSGLESL